MNEMELMISNGVGFLIETGLSVERQLTNINGGIKLVEQKYYDSFTLSISLVKLSMI